MENRRRKGSKEVDDFIWISDSEEERSDSGRSEEKDNEKEDEMDSESHVVLEEKGVAAVIQDNTEEEPLDKGDAEPPAPSSDPVQMPKAEETTSGQGRLVNESRFALLQKTTQALCKNLRDYTNKLMGCGVGQPETQRAGTSSSGSGGDYVPFSLRWVLLGVGVAIGAAGIAHLFSSRLGTSLEGKKPTEQPKM